MKKIWFVALYTALALFANTAMAADRATLEALREDTLKKLVFVSEPEAVPSTEFTALEGGTHSFEEFKGRWVLANFWATWCAPCRKEMPELDALEGEFGGDDFEVITIATGRNPPAAINRFFEEVSVEHLPVYLDPKQQLAREMGVLALPVTVLIDPEGREVARLRGDANWYSESARAIVSALIEKPATE